MNWITDLKSVFAAKRSHQGTGPFKAGTRPAIILQALCEGSDQSGASACRLIGSHNGDRDLRRVRKALKREGIPMHTYYLKGKNGREYKVTCILSVFRDRARNLIVGKAA